MLLRAMFVGLSFVCSCLSFSIAFGDSVMAGGDAYGAGDYTKALQIMKSPENINDPRAQYVIGLAYRFGNGVEQSSTEAVKWWTKSGEEGGFPRALYSLAVLYRDGEGVPQSHTKSFKLAMKSAEADTGEPYAFIGKAYRYGIGTARSDIMAMEYFEKAYFKKNFEGLNIMADMYRDGLGGPKSPEIAAYMYKRDFENSRRKSSRRNLTTLANQGVEYAQYADALLPKDKPGWISGLEALAEHGNSYAQCEVGLVYFKGSRAVKDLTKALRFFQRSAESDNLCGIYRLGSLYANGKGVAKDQDRAIRFFKRAINSSYKYAFNHPQQKDFWRKTSEGALKTINDQKAYARKEAENREARARDARLREESARRRRENAARAAAEKQAYQERCIQRKYICRDAIGMVNYEVCEYKDVDVCAAALRRSR